MTNGEKLNAKINMPVCALNSQDMGKNIKVAFFSNMMYGIEIF